MRADNVCLLLKLLVDRRQIEVGLKLPRHLAPETHTPSNLQALAHHLPWPDTEVLEVREIHALLFSRKANFYG